MSYNASKIQIKCIHKVYKPISIVSTLSQMIDFRLFQSQKSLLRTIFVLMKMVESSTNRYKTLWEKEKLLITSNFSFSHHDFKTLELQTHKNSFDPRDII